MREPRGNLDLFFQVVLLGVLFDFFGRSSGVKMSLIAELRQVGLDDVLGLFGGRVTVLPVLSKKVGGSLKRFFLLGCLQHFGRILLY